MVSMGQVTARISDGLEAALNRWATDEGQQRSDLIRQILTEAADARREGRAMFDRSELPSPADLQHLTAEVRIVLVELNRILRQNAKRDAELVGHAKADTLGVSDARTAIITQLTAELRKLFDAILARLAKLPAEQITALTASPAMAEIAAALKRIEQHPRLDEIRTLQEAHTVAMREHTATINRFIKQPRTIVRFLVWDRDWSIGKVLCGLAVAALLCLGTYHGLARMLPASWLAARSAYLQMGRGDQTICAVLNYRFSTTDCTTRFDGDTMRATVEVRHMPAKARR
jgi:hypothetical protein